MGFKELDAPVPIYSIQIIMEGHKSNISNNPSFMIINKTWNIRSCIMLYYGLF